MDRFDRCEECNEPLVPLLSLVNLDIRAKDVGKLPWYLKKREFRHNDYGDTTRDIAMHRRLDTMLLAMSVEVSVKAFVDLVIQAADRT